MVGRGMLLPDDEGRHGRDTNPAGDNSSHTGILTKILSFIAYNIRGYYDRGNFVVNLGCYFSPHLLVSSFL